ncbi:unnamed protein product [Symbiodinium sp. CCMP2592]|nr:unnamed protein product [Symbiodinium sp. CCMP2592]
MWSANMPAIISSGQYASTPVLLSHTESSAAPLLPLEEGQEAEAGQPHYSVPDVAPVTEGELDTARISVCVLVPDYVNEVFEIDTNVSRGEEHLQQVIAEARTGVQMQYFPFVAAVPRQSIPDTLIYLAYPLWGRGLCTTCFDLIRFDGRLFAQRLPPTVDRYVLLQAAGLAGGAEVDVFCPSHAGPLPEGAEVEFQPGQTVTFLPKGNPHDPALALLADDTNACGDISFGVVSDLSVSHFCLRAERSVFYRSDLASRHGLRLPHLVVTPARPRCTDVAIQGRPCRTVVAVGEQEDPQDSIETIGFIDGRPMMQGWIRILTRSDWLPLAPLRNGLMQSAPAGWQVAFIGCPRHWDWVWFASGQVIVAYLEPAHPDTPRSQQSGDSTAVPDSDNDGSPATFGGGGGTAPTWGEWPVQFNSLLGQTIVALNMCRFSLVLIVQQGSDGPVPVLLTDHIPKAVTHDLTAVTMPSPCAIDDVASLLASAWTPPGTLPPDLKIHPATAAALASHIPADDSSAPSLQQLAIYTDGSFDGTGSSWAFVVLAHTNHGCMMSSVNIMVLQLNTSEAMQVYCELSDFRVLHWSPRMLFVRFAKGLLSFMIFGYLPPLASAMKGASRVLYDVDFGQSGRLFDSIVVVCNSLSHKSSFVKSASQFPKFHGALGTFFSDTTWSLRQQRVWLRRRAHQASAFLASSALQWAYIAWRRAVPLSVVARKGCASVLLHLARLQHAVKELQTIKPAFRRTLCQDRKKYLSEVANTACVSSTRDVVAKLRPLIGPPRRKQKGPAPLPAIRLESGDFAESPHEATARWLRHFSEAEHGGPITPEVLIRRCQTRQAAANLEDLEVQTSELPSRADLETAMRAAKADRAVGNDILPAELWKVQAPILSRVMYPLLLKIAFRLEEPLQLKGGSMFHIWKAKGPQDACASYRGILVSSAFSKCVHGAFRTKCNQWFNALATPLQIGGRKGFPVQLAAHAARSFQQAALAKGYSAAIVFLDLREAFHKVARPLVHGGDLSDDHISKVLAAFHIPPAGMESLREYVRQSALIRDAGASDWAAALMREFHTDTWFSIDDQLAAVSAGTRPGDSLADVVFSFLFSSVLRRVRDAILAEDISVSLPWHPSWARDLEATHPPAGELAPIDVSWMDDLALLIWDTCPHRLLDSVRKAAEILLDECVKALLYPNLDPGKTEAIVSLVGKDSRKLRAQLFRSSVASLDLSPRVHPAAALRLVPQYRHLGGILHWKGALRFEIRSRLGQAWQAFKKHRRAIFASPVVSHREKALLFQSLVMSAMLFGAGTWVYRDAREVEAIVGAQLTMARQMLRPSYDWESALHLGSGLVLATARLSTIADELHAARLRHLAILVARAPDEFWAILHFDRQWLQMTSASLEWLRESLQHGGQDTVDIADWPGTLQQLSQQPRRWKRRISVALHVRRLVDVWKAEVTHFHGLLLRALLSAGAFAADGERTASSVSELCGPCNKVFTDLRCWSHHAFKCHGRLREARLYASGTQCGTCLRHFASNFKLSNHLEYSTECLAALVARGARSEIQPGRNSKKFRTGDEIMCPVITAEGPACLVPPAAFIPEPQRADPQILQDLEDLFAHPCEVTTLTELLQIVRGIFQRVCLQRSRLQATAAAWRRELAHNEDVSVMWSAWHVQIADFLCQTDIVEWLSHEAQGSVSGHSTFRDSAAMLSRLSFDFVSLPPSTSTVHDAVTFCAASPKIQGNPVPDWWQHTEHARFIADPKLFRVKEWCADSKAVIRGFCLGGLLSDLSAPMPLRSFRRLEPQLHRLRLFADIIRGIVELWLSGRPAFILCPAIVCPGLDAISRLSRFQCEKHGLRILSNFPDVGELLRFVSP